MHFSALLTALLLVLSLVFYARLDLILAVAMAALMMLMVWLIVILPVGVGFYIAVLFWLGLDNFMDIKLKEKAFFLKRPPIPSHWAGMVHGCLFS